MTPDSSSTRRIPRGGGSIGRVTRSQSPESRERVNPIRSETKEEGVHPGSVLRSDSRKRKPPKTPVTASAVSRVFTIAITRSALDLIIPVTVFASNANGPEPINTLVAKPGFSCSRNGEVRGSSGRGSGDVSPGKPTVASQPKVSLALGP